MKIPDQFFIGDVEYWTDTFGAIHQRDLTVKIVYDVDYVKQRYDSIPDIVREMSFLRTGFLRGAIGDYNHILDIGYGNGDFLKVQKFWSQKEMLCHGVDISGYPLPEACEFISWDRIVGAYVNKKPLPFDAVTMFDSLEHIPYQVFLHWLNTRVIATTLPWCHARKLGLDWFEQWKHRRPGEHLHHYDPDSATALFEYFGFKRVACEPIEDGIRRVRNGESNTFTAVFKRL